MTGAGRMRARWFRLPVLAAAYVLAAAAACDGSSTPTSPSPAPMPAPAPSPAPPSPPPPPPVVTFEPGQHRIGSDIDAGRYYADPAAGCYWARQSEFGGTPAETIAFQFIDFDAAQWVVDISPSDRGFTARAPCGTWFSTPRHPMQASIPPGVWVVGAQVAPGLYQTSASPGCHWERLRHFTGEPDGVLAQDLLGSAGPQFVNIAAGDAGFRSDAACGTWTPVQTTTRQ